MDKKNIHLILIHGFATNKIIWNKLENDSDNSNIYFI